jgi:hypothetical protein
VRWVVLVGLTAAVFLLLKKPDPVAKPQDAATMATNIQSYQTKLQQLEQAKEQGQSQAEVHLSAGEISAAISQVGAIPAPGVETAPPAPGGATAEQQPKVTDYQVSFEGDVARGQFLTEVAGKQLYVTIGGHLGARDGYATFDPTEFKVGDLSVPVSLVNDQLQRRLQEQRDRLKLPDFVADLRVVNGELVIKEK